METLQGEKDLIETLKAVYHTLEVIEANAKETGNRGTENLCSESMEWIIKSIFKAGYSIGNDGRLYPI